MGSVYNGVSENELKIIKIQAERRAQLRHEFLKQKTHPWKHAAESGHVFDPAMQRYASMKITTLERFRPTTNNSLFGIVGVLAPMFIYGYFVWKQRDDREQKIRRGELLYKDRLFKFQ